MILWRRKTFAEKHAEEQEKKKSKPKQEGKPLTAAQKRKVELYLKKANEMNHLMNIDNIEIR